MLSVLLFGILIQISGVASVGVTWGEGNGVTPHKLSIKISIAALIVYYFIKNTNIFSHDRIF